MQVHGGQPLVSIDDSRWHAVALRDGRSDGAFVYAVRSTGVYCRPSCPSRRPRREHVVFFVTPAAAESSGFRPCRRCRPAGHAEPDPWPDRIEATCRFLRSAARRVPLSRLASRAGVSPFHLQRTFKRLVGVTPREFADAVRLERARRALKRGGNVTEAVVEAGFGSSSRFYERVAPLLGMAPAMYRRGAPGVTVRFTIVDSSLGKLLLASTDRGVCFVAMGSLTAELRKSLAREYPQATLKPAGSTLARWASRVTAHLDGAVPALTLPLDIRATAFQWKVWTALARIPYGERRTYSEIAAAIGRPSAARAVARACATNPVALVVPCHRVVPASGGFAGYRWGVERKKALLAREAGGRMPAR